MAYDIEVTNSVGQGVADLSAKGDSTNLDKIVEELNGPGEAQITMDTTDVKCLAVLGPNGIYRWQRYLRIWNGSQIRFWGPVVTGVASGSKTTVTAKGGLEILRHRFLGPHPSLAGFDQSPQQAQGVPGASVHFDFPLDIADWTFVGCTGSVSTDVRSHGGTSLKIENAAADEDAYAEFSFTYTPELGPDGSIAPLFLKGLIQLGGDFGGPAFEERGLYARVENPGLFDEQWAPITANTPIGSLFRFETAVKIAIGSSPIINTVKVRLYAPMGTVYYTGVNIYRQTTIGAAVELTGGPEFLDKGEVLTRLVEYGCGGGTSPDLGKSALGWDVEVPDCGVISSHHYRLDSDQNIWEAIEADYIRAGHYDVDLVPNDDLDGWVFRGHTPHKGESKPKLALEHRKNIVGEPEYICDGMQATNKPRVIGRGAGPSKEVAEVFDSSVFGGLTLESVEAAASDAPLSSIYDRAVELFAAGVQAGKVPSVRTKAGVAGDLLAAGLTVGDSVPVVINYGWIQESTERRVVRITEYANGVADIEFNEEP